MWISLHNTQWRFTSMLQPGNVLLLAISNVFFDVFFTSQTNQDLCSSVGHFYGWYIKPYRFFNQCVVQINQKNWSFLFFFVCTSSVFLDWSVDSSCNTKPHLVHCEEPFSKLTKTSFLQFGHFKVTTNKKSIDLAFINQPSDLTIYQECSKNLYSSSWFTSKTKRISVTPLLGNFNSFWICLFTFVWIPDFSSLVLSLAGWLNCHGIIRITMHTGNSV